MAALTHPDPPGDAPGWSGAHRVAFRFLAVYLFLYNVPFPLGVIPGTDKLAELCAAPLSLRLKRIEVSQPPLFERPFRWVQEYPFNR